MHISFTDLLTSLSLIAQINCELHKLVLGRSKILAGAISTITFTAPNFRYIILAVASCERYLALCKPFTYESNIFIRHINRCVYAMWLITGFYQALREIVFGNEVCLNNIVGATNFEGAGPKSWTYLGIGIPIVTIIVFSSRVAHELRKMRIRLQDSQLMKASLYVVAINMEFIACLIPVFVCFLMTMIYKCGFTGQWISLLMFILYGALNTLTYGWLTKSYRQEVLKLFGCASNTVAPTPTPTEYNTKVSTVHLA